VRICAGGIRKLISLPRLAGLPEHDPGLTRTDQEFHHLIVQASSLPQELRSLVSRRIGSATGEPITRLRLSETWNNRNAGAGCPCRKCHRRGKWCIGDQRMLGPFREVAEGILHPRKLTPKPRVFALFLSRREARENRFGLVVPGASPEFTSFLRNSSLLFFS